MTETTTAAEADVPSLLAAENLAFNALHECIVPKGAELQISDAMRALRSAIDANLTSAERPLLAAEHKGRKVDYSGLISQVHRALRREPFLGEMMRPLGGHLEELGRRWYAGDAAVVDEILQLYCIETEAREAIAAAPKAAPVEQGDALPREEFAWLVVQEACETDPADEDDPECIRILRRDLKSAVLAAFLRHDAQHEASN